MRKFCKVKSFNKFQTVPNVTRSTAITVKLCSHRNIVKESRRGLTMLLEGELREETKNIPWCRQVDIVADVERMAAGRRVEG
jgi:hypothetical protein